MFGLKPKLPISEEDRQWVDEGFNRLARLLGRNRMLQAEMVLPDAEHFPDVYDKSEAAAEKMFLRICVYMQVDPSQIELEIFPDELKELKSMMPYWGTGKEGGAAGLYFHPEDEAKKIVVALKHSQLEEPMELAATITHELSHVILLGGGLMDRSVQDMEPLTDLTTVFLGMGIFNANCAVRFKQWQNDRKRGWSMSRLGYLSEEIFGYALAKFAHERGERAPKWTRHLATNPRSYFKKSAAWLEENETATRKPIG
jgi:hypothetical protein